MFHIILLGTISFDGLSETKFWSDIELLFIPVLGKATTETIGIIIIPTIFYTLVKKTGLNHNIQFSVNLLVNGKKYMGSGHKIKTAEINSAKKALIDLLGF